MFRAQDYFGYRIQVVSGLLKIRSVVTVLGKIVGIVGSGCVKDWGMFQAYTNQEGINFWKFWLRGMVVMRSYMVLDIFNADIQAFDKWIILVF